RPILLTAPPFPVCAPTGLSATSDFLWNRSTGLPLAHARQALRAISADFRARHGHLHVKVARNLFLQLFVQSAFELPHFAALQARHMDMIPRPVRLVVVPVAAQVQ